MRFSNTLAKGFLFVLYPEFDVVCNEHHLCTLIVVIDR